MQVIMGILILRIILGILMLYCLSLVVEKYESPSKSEAEIKEGQKGLQLLWMQQVSSHIASSRWVLATYIQILLPACAAEMEEAKGPCNDMIDYILTTA